MAPKRGAYPREFREEAVRMLRAGREVKEVARELGVTTASLNVWIFKADGGHYGPDLSRDAIVRATVVAYERLEEFLSAGPDSVLAQPMAFTDEAIDRWRVKDAVAHMTHYKARVVHRLTKGEGSVLEDYFDPAEWSKLEASDHTLPTMDDRTRRRHGPNHLVYERWCDRPSRDVLAFHREVYDHVLSALRSGPNEWFAGGAARPRIPRTAVGALAHHYDTHLKDMCRAVGRDVRSRGRG